MREHLRFNPDGSLAGLYSVDVRRLGQVPGMWNRIELIVAEYARIHPEEIREAVSDAALEREGAANRYCATPGKHLRKGLKLPAGLLLKLQSAEPDLFENRRHYREFIRRFPGFRTCEVV